MRLSTMSDQLLPCFNLKTTECNLKDPQGPELFSSLNQSWHGWEAQEPPLLQFLVKSIGLSLQIHLWPVYHHVAPLWHPLFPCYTDLLLAWLLLYMLPCTPFSFKDSRQQWTLVCLDWASSALSLRPSLVLWLNVGSPPKFRCWSLNSQCDGIWMWSLWDIIDPWGWRHHEGIRALKRRDTREISYLSIMWEHSKKVAICKPSRRFWWNITYMGTLNFDFPSSRMVRNKCPLLMLSKLW